MEVMEKRERPEGKEIKEGDGTFYGTACSLAHSPAAAAAFPAALSPPHANC